MSDSLLADVGTDSPTEPIHVLLVDDDRQWAQLIAGDIEDESADIEVTVAGSAREGMEVLRDGERVDCIVSDYQMPGEDGIQFLEQIRQDRPEFPFLLVTSQGSESVAARAIDAGVTDYLIKDFGIEQATQFVSKIQTAVSHHRLQQALEESEERYRTVTEQSRDAIAVFQNDQLIFCNQRLVELTGRERNRMRNSDIVADVVHPDDREQVLSVADDWMETDADPRLHEARVVQPDGTVRHCEYTGRQIDYDGETAILVSIRDVTDRQRRERELRWERELNRTIQEALVESRTRESLERKVTEQLQRHGYALAWVGERVGNELAPRVVGGDRRYVEAIDRTVEGGGAASEPSIWAARTGEPQFHQDFDNLAATEWRDTATGFRYRAGAGVPLVYNDIPYGVLAVYGDEPARFDDTEQRLLTELADTVAFAIHSLETQSSLAADQTIGVTVQIDGGYYLLDLEREGAFADCESVFVRGTLPLDDEALLQYLEVEGGTIGAILDLIDGHTDVRDAAVVSEAEPNRLQVTVYGSVPEASLAARGTVVRSTTIGEASATIELELPGKEDVRATVDHLQDTFGTVSVQAVTESEQRGTIGRGQPPGTDALTEKQRTAVQAAYYEGYFEEPRGSTATEVAESLGVTHSTFLRHLRAAQQKLFGARFE